MSYDSIRALIEQRLAAEFAESPTYPISWENVDFQPPNDQTWLQVFIRYGDAGYMTMLAPAGLGMDRQNGTLTVNVFTPIGSGMSANLAAAERAKALFNRVNLSDGLKFDPASGPALVSPAQPGSFVQTQITVTFESYIDS
jgi:hypothetical protein